MTAISLFPAKGCKYMHRQFAVIGLAALVLLGVSGQIARAQTYEVRTFLDNTPGVATTTDNTYQYLQSCVKARYVCPVCSYSSDQPGNCPNPWNAPGHPANVALQDYNALPWQRVLSLAMPQMPAGKGDLQLPDITGALHSYAVLGRPFKPLDGANARRAILHAQAAGLINNNPAIAPVIQAGSTHLRFLVVPPTPLRREPIGDTNPANSAVVQRRPTAQADPGPAAGGNSAWQPQIVARTATARTFDPVTELPNYLKVGVNPYRVDEGDYWWVRYTETAVDGGGGVPVVAQARVETYSVMYGSATATLNIQPANAKVDTEFEVLVDSGALRLRFLQPFTNSIGTHTWVIGFMVRSNCRLIPGWRDVVDDTQDPPFTSLDNPTGPKRGNAAFDLLNDPFPAAKRCWFNAAAGAPNVTTESTVVETGRPALAYVLPSNVTGLGAIAVQWANDVAGTWAPAENSDLTAGITYHRNGGEWQYDCGVNGGQVVTVTNDDLANKVVNYDGTKQFVKLLGTQFMSTRVDVPPTGNTWLPAYPLAAPQFPAELAPLPYAYPNVIVGFLDAGTVFGAFAPGTFSPERTFTLLNRWDGSSPTKFCASCGATWGPGSTVSDVACPYDPTGWRVTGAGDATYNGVYYPYDATPIYQNHAVYWNGTRFLYWQKTTAPARWLLSDAIGTAPNLAAYGGAPGVELPCVPWVVLSGGGAPAPTLSGGGLTLLGPQGAGTFQAATSTWREATSVGRDQRVAGLPGKRSVLPAESVAVKGAIVATNIPQTEQMHVNIPRYQPPSVPGNGAENWQANDLGYRGGQVIFYNIDAPNTNSGLTGGWDTFYKNPDCGYFQPEPGVWPYDCPVGGETYWAPGNCTNPAHGNPALVEVPGRHWYCPVCGSEWQSIGTGFTCPLDGGIPVQIAANQVVRQEHLVAEEFDPIDVQISVARKLDVAQSTGDIAIGRTAPGVITQQPDTTTGIITNHRAFPADTSPLPLTPFRPSLAKLRLRNEGNVAAGMRLANTYDFDVNRSLDRALDHYLRVDVDAFNLSYGRKAQSGPITRDTFVTRTLHSDGSVPGPFEQSLQASLVWDAMAQTPGAAAGTNAFGFITAGYYGTYNDAGTYTARAKPVPMGQPVGTYTGGQLQYVDVNNNGAFDFYSVAAGANVTSDVAQYNPSVDLPLEPLVGISRGEMRVFETRLPQNDPYARDSDPVVLPSPTPGVMQVIWASNRVSTDPTFAAAGKPAVGAAGSGPAHIPASNSPLNLVYITTSGYTGVPADDPLYRMYTWPVNGSGVLSDPEPLTTSNPGTVNGAPWSMFTSDYSEKWAFWHRTTRHPGGVESTLRFNKTPGNDWTWNPAAETFIYDTGLAKQGLRGFALPPGGGSVGAMRAWLFWHSGAPGRERLMYRWDYDGTVSNKEASVPVTNQALSGQFTDLVKARMLDGSLVTLRKPGGTPFTYTKDASVFLSGGSVNVFFSGYVTHDGQADICWTTYNLATMGPASVNDNYAKRPFPTVNYEEMESDPLHQDFGTRHLDWLVDSDFQNGPNGTINPTFQLQLIFDTIGDNVPPTQQTFNVTWNGGTYNRARGTYTVTPVLNAVGGSSLPAQFGIPVAGGWQIRDPNSPAATPRPLTAEINPATGIFRFSSPLYNEDAPNDPTAAFTSALTSSGVPLNNVVLSAHYIPYIYRVTRDGAQDDSPSAFLDPTAAHRLTVFWRRSYPVGEAPYFGRAAFMYKVYTTSVQVGQPPVTSGPTITDALTGGAVTPRASDTAAGIYDFDDSLAGRYLNFSYNMPARAEQHQVIGWSREMVVPLDTVIGEGSFVAVPEVFDVNMNEGAGGAVNAPAVRYWLFWSSPRGVYDLRLVEDTKGTRYTPGAGQPYDPAVHPSSDIYSAVVAPEFGSLAPERTIPALSPDPT